MYIVVIILFTKEMKQLDKDIEWKLNWLIAPLVIVALVFAADLLFDLRLGTLEWIKPALLGCALIPFVGFSIAYIRYKCWGLLSVTIALFVVMLLNMGNFFVDLILK